jgi:hypothetical protein
LTIDRARTSLRALHAALLIAFSALTGLFEGPAEIACALALASILTRDRIAGFRLDVVEVGLLTWFLAGIPGTLDAESSIASEATLRPLLALAYIVGKRGIGLADDRTIERVGLAFVLALSVNAAYGWIQVLLFDPPLERWIIGRARSANLTDPAHPERLRMATGLYYNRLKLAHTAILGMGLVCLSLARSGIGAKKQARDLAAAIVIGGAVLLSYRRAAPAALAAASVFFGLLALRFRWAVASAIVSLAIVGFYATTDLGRERAGTAGSALGERLHVFESALSLIRDHMLLGVGHGDYKAAIAAYSGDIPQVLWTSPHNLPLHVLAETGLIGFGGLAVAIGAAITRAVRRVRAESSDTPEAQADRFALLGLLTLLALGLLHSALYHAPVALSFFTLLGVANRPTRKISPEAATS